MKTNKLKLITCALSLCTIGIVLHADPLPKKIIKKPSKPLAIKPAKTSLSELKVRNVQFAFDESNIRPEYFAELDRIAKLMIDSNAAVQVNGHTDNVGGYVYNWKLSEARALAVKQYLADKGADTSRIASTEYGYTKPVASNKTPQGRQKNRRVEMNFVQ